MFCSLIKKIALIISFISLIFIIYSCTEYIMPIQYVGLGGLGSSSPTSVLDRYQTQEDFETLYGEAEDNDGYVTVDGVDLFVTRSHGDDISAMGYWVLTINGDRQIVFSLNKIGENVVNGEYLGCLFSTELGQEGFRCTKTYNGSLNRIAYSKAYFDLSGTSSSINYNWVGVVDNPTILEDNDGTKYESFKADEGYSPVEGMFVVMPNDTIVDSGTGKSYNANADADDYVGITLSGEQNTIIVLQLK